MGLDVHKDSIAAAAFRAGRSKEPVFEKTCSTDETSIRRFFGGLKRRYRVQACYEAGCMGFWLQRLLEGMDIACRVVAPSMLPRKPGDRVKTDRRDARKLAVALRSEDIEGIFVPGAAHESIRDLLRTREDLRIDALRQKQRLSKFLLRRNKIYRDGKAWTLRHIAWLKTLEFDEPADRSTFHMYYLRMQLSQEHLKEMDRQLESIALAEPFAESVGKLRCLKGVEWLTAFTFVVEVGDFRRFRSAGSFMAFLGMVPAEYSSGERRTRGSITKTGNSTPIIMLQMKLYAVSISVIRDFRFVELTTRTLTCGIQPANIRVINRRKWRPAGVHRHWRTPLVSRDSSLQRDRVQDRGRFPNSSSLG